MLLSGCVLGLNIQFLVLFSVIFVVLIHAKLAQIVRTSVQNARLANSLHNSPGQQICKSGHAQGWSG